VGKFTYDPLLVVALACHRIPLKYATAPPGSRGTALIAHPTDQGAS